MTTKALEPEEVMEEVRGSADGGLEGPVYVYYTMLLARALNERMWLLARQGKALFVVTGEGHEAAQVGSTCALDPDTDWLVPYYRDIGSVLVMGMSPLDIMLGVFARAADPSSGGRQMPCHFGSRRLRILSGSSVIATQITHAVGIALAAKLRGEPAVTLVCFGDGATSRGEFHEGLNMAGVYGLPIVFLCESNSYAISMPVERQVAGGDIAGRAQAYGFPGIAVDGTDVRAVYETTKAAVDRARAGEGPSLIEAKVYRYRPHTSNDDDSLYREREELEAWMKRDPVVVFGRLLERAGFLSSARKAELRDRAAKEAKEAGRQALDSPLPSPEDALAHVYG